MTQRLREGQWQMIYHVQESAEERDGLECVVWSAVSLEAAKELADEILGAFLSLAGPWENSRDLTAPEWQPLQRYIDTAAFHDPAGLVPDVPAGRWQHIRPNYLYGAAPGSLSPFRHHDGRST